MNTKTNSFLATLLLLGSASGLATMGLAFGQSTHAEINSDALSGKFSARNLQIINQASEAEERPDSEEVADPKRHFQDETFNKSFALIDREKKVALDCVADADTNEEDRARALWHFGILLHVMQDFYGNTNYLEYSVATIKSRGGMPDPYNIELADWTRVRKGLSVYQTDPKFSKTDSQSDAGKEKLGSATYFSAAKELAVKETTRQLGLFETQIKSRYGDKATALISAFEMASCPAKIDPTKLPDVP